MRCEGQAVCTLGQKFPEDLFRLSRVGSTVINPGQEMGMDIRSHGVSGLSSLGITTGAGSFWPMASAWGRVT